MSRRGGDSSVPHTRCQRMPEENNNSGEDMIVAVNGITEMNKCYDDLWSEFRKDRTRSDSALTVRRNRMFFARTKFNKNIRKGE